MNQPRLMRLFRISFLATLFAWSLAACSAAGTAKVESTKGTDTWNEESFVYADNIYQLRLHINLKFQDEDAAKVAIAELKLADRAKWATVKAKLDDLAAKDSTNRASLQELWKQVAAKNPNWRVRVYSDTQDASRNKVYFLEFFFEKTVTESQYLAFHQFIADRGNTTKLEAAVDVFGGDSAAREVLKR
jgi:hypothetical protein